MNIKYYLIHNNDKKREEHMKESFKRVKIDENNVKWILETKK